MEAGPARLGPGWSRLFLDTSRYRFLIPKLTADRVSNVSSNGREGIVPTGGHGKTERRNFRVRSRGWGTQARPSPRGRMVIHASRGVNLFRKSRGSAAGCGDGDGRCVVAAVAVSARRGERVVHTLGKTSS